MTVDSDIAMLIDAHQRCKNAMRDIRAAIYAHQQGAVGSDLAFNSAVESFYRARDHFNLVYNNAMRDIRAPTAAEPAPVRPVVADVRPVPVHRTVAQPPPIRPVVADVPEEQNPAAPEESVGQNWNLHDLDPNRKA